MKNRLEELRKQRGIKQEDLAKALEVSRQTIGSLENGRYNPSIQLAFKIARYFNMNIDEIFIYDIEAKVLEWLSRAAFKTAPYSQEWRNRRFHEFMLSGEIGRASCRERV